MPVQGQAGHAGPLELAEDLQVDVPAVIGGGGERDFRCLEKVDLGHTLSLSSAAKNRK